MADFLTTSPSPCTTLRLVGFERTINNPGEDHDDVNVCLLAFLREMPGAVL